VIVAITLVGRNKVSVIVSILVDAKVCVINRVLIVGGEPRTEVSVLVTVSVSK
jgi:hypothetical protein